MDSIGDFAENLILESVADVKQGKALPPTSKGSGLAPAGIDISETRVPDSFMKELLGENFHPQEGPTAETIPELVWTDDKLEEKPSLETLTESTAQQLVPLLEEVRNLLKEMTAATTGTGHIGCNLAGPEQSNPGSKKPKKGKRDNQGYIDTLKDSIRERLVSRRK